MFSGETREGAIALRKRGCSLNEMSRRLHISKSTASLWSRGIELPKVAKDILLTKQAIGRQKGNEGRRAQGESRRKSIEKQVERYLSRSPLHKSHDKILLALLYGCEGAKRNETRVNFVNSDPALIRYFLYLFRRSYEVDESKFRVLMHLHEYHDEQKQKEYWAHVTDIKKDQFTKSFQKKNGKKNIRADYQGCVSIRYGSKSILEELMIIYRKLLYR